jgi:hypothetical protein
VTVLENDGRDLAYRSLPNLSGPSSQIITKSTEKKHFYILHRLSKEKKEKVWFIQGYD